MLARSPIVLLPNRRMLQAISQPSGSFAPLGLALFPLLTHGLRRGLHSCAAFAAEALQNPEQDADSLSRLVLHAYQAQAACRSGRSRGGAGARAENLRQLG